MRTTVTLDPDVALLVRETMRVRDVSFKHAVNDAIRAALAPPDQPPPSVPEYAMGGPLVNLTKALQLAGDLETEELARKLAIGS
jgi:hypothetical protein